MPRYRFAKTAEHAVSIEWLRRRLAALRIPGCVHAKLLDQLHEEFQELERGLALLKRAGAIPGLEEDADEASKSIAIYRQAIAVHYIAGLDRQTALEIELRLVLLNMCRRLGLDWIEDVLVRLSNHLAILPAFRERRGIPVFYGPPNLLECFLSLPGIYHEFGHNVFVKDPLIGEQLAATIWDYFEAAKAKLGPVLPDLRRRQEAELEAAVEYWNGLRIAELFCDLFAGYVCGPANVISIMDLAMAYGLPPTDLIPDYPPNAVRVTACCHLLTPAQREQALMQEAFAEWAEYERRFKITPGFGTACPPDLVELLAKKTEELIARRLAGIVRYNKVLPSLTEAHAIQAGSSLEDLINAGMTVLLEAPDSFDSWEKQARPFVV